MALNDEINEKTINLVARVGKLTADELRKVLEKIIAEITKDKNTVPAADKKPELKHGKQTLQQLSKHNDGLSTVELTDPNLRLLQQVMKKHKPYRTRGCQSPHYRKRGGYAVYHVHKDDSGQSKSHSAIYSGKIRRNKRGFMGNRGAFFTGEWIPY